MGTVIVGSLGAGLPDQISISTWMHHIGIGEEASMMIEIRNLQLLMFLLEPVE
jgi:hypothetical protein